MDRDLHGPPGGAPSDEQPAQTDEAMRSLPVRVADRIAIGRRVDSFQQWLEHAAPEDPHGAAPNSEAVLGLGRGMTIAGAVDNQELESRANVLTFATAPLREALELSDHVEVDLHLTSDVEHLDVFARLCDVEPDRVAAKVLRRDRETRSGH